MQEGWKVDGKEIEFSVPCARACGNRLEGRVTIREAVSTLAGGRDVPAAIVPTVRQALRLAQAMGEKRNAGEGEGKGGGGLFDELPFGGGIVCEECLELLEGVERE